MSDPSGPGGEVGEPDRDGHLVPRVRPDVTVVVVNYNGAHLLPECLDSVRSQSVGLDRLDVVVVDNASSDGSAELVRTRYPWVRLVPSPRNLGFAGGNDLVLDDVRTPYVLLLNSDARADPRCLEHLLRAAGDPGHRRVAAFNATVLLADRFRPAGPDDAADAVVRSARGPVVPDRAGGVRLVNSTGNLVTTDGYGVDRGWLEDATHHRPPPDVFGFCGAAVLLRTRALADVGTFDDRFFLYYEDTDLSWRLRRAGWSVRHVPDAVVDHIHAASSVEGSALFHFHNDRNRLLTVVKNGSARLVARVLGRTLLTLASTSVRRREPWSRTWLRWRSFAGFARLLPHAVRHRWSPTAPRRVPRRQVERLLSPAPTPARRASGPVVPS